MSFTNSAATAVNFAPSRSASQMVLGAAGDVFDSNWAVFGLAAEAVIALCIASQWIATHRANRFVLVPWTIYLGITATFMLAVYAWIVQEWIFLLSQLLSALIGLRLLAWLRETPAPIRPGEKPKLPVVAPDSAELKLPRKEPPSGIKSTSKVPG
ncbi:MAG TPA: hypothetical protein VJZ71_12135 [Phycisphaerae bacterium]|nr:hypothetical protein [Phycisphaerae bacterium]